MSSFSSINTRIGKSLDTVADLKSLRAYRPSRIQDGDTVLVTSGETLGDQAGGAYVWVEHSRDADDGVTCIRPGFAVGSGRWVKMFGQGERGPTGADSTVPGPIGQKGDPGGNVADVGTFAQAKVMTIPANASTIRLSDRNKAVFERDTGAFGDLPSAYPAGENIWWFRDQSAAKWILAGRELDIMAGGAVISKTIDNHDIIQSLLDFGSIAKRNVFVPAGTFSYTGTLAIKGATGLVGIPGVSILYCTQDGKGAILMQGNGGTLYGITRIHYLPRPIALSNRSSEDAANGIYARGATNFTIQFCRTEGPQAASLMLRGCQFGRVTNNWFESSLADSIHVTAAAKNDAPIYNPDGSYAGLNQIPIPAYRLHIGDNIVNNSGDDNIAVVSYVSHAVTEATSVTATKYPGYYTYYTESNGTRTYQANNQSINVTGNSTYGGDARGITVVGGKNVNVTGNYIEDPVVAGILAYGEESYQTYGCENVNITGNTLVNTGNDGSYRPLRLDAYGNQMLNYSGVLGATRNDSGASNASVIISGRSQSYPSQNISFRSNMMTGMRYRGVNIDTNVLNVDIADNTFRDSTGVAVFLNAGTNVSILNNRISDARDGAISVNIFNCAGHIVVDGNALHNINTSGSNGTDAIHFEGQPAAGVLSTTISNNRVSGPQTYERFVEAFFDGVIAENNIGLGDVGLGSTPNSVRQRVKATSVATVTDSAIPPGNAPTALSDTVTRDDFLHNAIAQNATKDRLNTLINTLVAAGLIKQP